MMAVTHGLRHRLVAVFLVAGSVVGCGFRVGDPMLGELDDAGIAGALAGTWVCTEIYMIDGLDPSDYEVTFSPGSGSNVGGTYTTKSEGSGEWSVLKAWRDAEKEYFATIAMNGGGGQKGLKGNKVVDVKLGEWDLGSMTRQSFVRRANGVALKYRKKT